MTSAAPLQTTSDPKITNDIVDRLKKQGLFDKFRKECLADVDTKPAYQNLRHRVEGAVGRFLSTQTWHPKLNKNQLRDSLRRHITELPMLSSGVDRIVEQVVYPKIYTDFKPEIDKIVCEHLGIDPEQWELKQKLKKELQQRKQQELEEQQQREAQQQLEQQQHSADMPPDIPFQFGFPPEFVSPNRGHIPSLMDLPVRNEGVQGANPPAEPMPPNLPPAPPGIEPPPIPGITPPKMNTAPSMEPPIVPGLSGGFSPPGVNPPGINSAINQAVLNAAMMRMNLPAVPGLPVPPIGMPNYGFPTPPFGMSTAGPFTFGGQQYPQVPGQNFGQTFPGVTPNPTLPGQMGFPPGQVPPAVPGVPGFPVPSSAIETNTTTGATTSVNPPPIPQNVELMDVFRLMRNAAEADAEKERKEKEEKEKEEKEKAEKEKKKKLEPLTVEDLLNIPLPKPAPTKPKTSGKGKQDSTGTSSRSESPSVAPKSQGESEGNQIVEVSGEVDNQENIVLVAQQGEDGNLENVQIVEQVEISQGEAGDAEMQVEAGENDDSQPAKVYHFAWDDVDVDALSDVTISSVHTSDISSYEEEEENTEEGAGSEEDSEDKRTSELNDSIATDKKEGSQSPEHQSEEAAEMPVVPDTESNVESVTSPVTSPEKAVVSDDKRRPRKLLSLQYNYSDSEDEESREERKARVAREKAERYARRLQRRAEIEAKKREREEEKARLREEKEKEKSETEDKDLKKGSEEDEKPEEPKSEKEEEVTSEDKAEEATETSPEESTESQKEETAAEAEQKEVASPRKNSEDTSSLSSPTKSSSASPLKSPQKGDRKRRTKQALKEQLREQKVIEKKMALRSRRQRKMNRKYLSDDFTSIFTENKQLLESGESYVEVVEAVETVGVEEVMDTSVEVASQDTDVDYTHGIELETQEGGQGQITMAQLATMQHAAEQDENCEFQEVMLVTEQAVDQPGEPVEDHNHSVSTSELPPFTHMTRSKSRAMSDAASETGQGAASEKGSRPTTPYSEISADSFHSDIGRSAPSSGRRTPDGGAGEGRVTRRRSGQALSPFEAGDPYKHPQDDRHHSQQRYDDSDLYKPRHSYQSRRRGADPQGARGSSPSPKAPVTRGLIDASSPRKQIALQNLPGPGGQPMKGLSSQSAISVSSSESDDDSRKYSRRRSRSRSRSWTRSRSRSRSRSYSRSSSRSSFSSSSSSSSSSYSSDSEQKRRRKKRKSRRHSRSSRSSTTSSERGREDPNEEDEREEREEEEEYFEDEEPERMKPRVPVHSDRRQEQRDFRKRRRSPLSEGEEEEGEVSDKEGETSDEEQEEERSSQTSQTGSAPLGTVSNADSSEEDRNHPKRPLDDVNFGEAARRVAKRFIDDVDFGEAARKHSPAAARGGVQARGHRSGPGQGPGPARGGWGRRSVPGTRGGGGASWGESFRPPPGAPGYQPPNRYEGDSPGYQPGRGGATRDRFHGNRLQGHSPMKPHSRGFHHWGKSSSFGAEGEGRSRQFQRSHSQEGSWMRGGLSPDSFPGQSPGRPYQERGSSPELDRFVGSPSKFDRSRDSPEPLSSSQRSMSPEGSQRSLSPGRSRSPVAVSPTRSISYQRTRTVSGGLPGPSSPPITRRGLRDRDPMRSRGSPSPPPVQRRLRQRSGSPPLPPPPMRRGRPPGPPVDLPPQSRRPMRPLSPPGWGRRPAGSSPTGPTSPEMLPGRETVVMTRAGRKRNEEQALPPAKRLRSAYK